MLTSEALDWLILILKERFDLDFILTYQNEGLLLLLKDSSDGSLFFPILDTVFFESKSDFHCFSWDAEKEDLSSALGLPLLAPSSNELPRPLISIQTNQTIINYDILGLTYWMLNRIEEIGRTDLDNHGRFPATSSHAYKNDYLERPIVDEWLYVLGQVILKVWPTVELKNLQFNMKVSHDVDAPSICAFKSWKSVLRMMGGHLLKRRDVKSLFTTFIVKWNSKINLYPADPYNTFDWLMDVSGKHNLTSSFYFISGRTDKSKDADYELEHPIIQNLMKHIHERGHEIGLHPSYGSYQSRSVIAKEADHLRTVLAKNNIIQSTLGGRMHYLRWEQPGTLQAWNDAGMLYDTTLSYADLPGFRCGTCFEYPAFNPATNEILQVRIRPLIAMECTVISERYTNLGYTQAALDKMIELKVKCRAVKGRFTLLWHNSHFTNKEDFEMYQKIIEA